MTDLPARLQYALFDRYRLERELAQGGMATVYLARAVDGAVRVHCKKDCGTDVGRVDTAVAYRG